jgi:hypothetical protein
MNRIKQLYAQASRHADRWLENGSEADLESAISGFRDLESLLPDDAELWIPVAAQLGFCLAGRYVRTESAADRDAAIDGLTRLVARPDSKGELDGSRKLLGQLLAARATSAAPDGEAASAPAAGQPPVQVPDEQARRDLETALGLLSVAAQSRAVSKDERAEAAYMRARVTAVLALARASETWAAGGLPDLADVLAARRGLAADDPYAPMLLLESGLIKGAQADRNREPGGRAEAIGDLTQGLQETQPEYVRRGLAVVRLTQLLLATMETDVADVPVGRIVSAAEAGLASPGTGPPEAAALHVMLGLAYGIGGAQGGRRDGDQPALDHLRQARQLLPGHPELGALVTGATAALLNRRLAADGNLEDRAAFSFYLAQTQQAEDEHGLFQAEHARAAEQIAHRGLMRAMVTGSQLGAALGASDGPTADRLLAELEQILAGIPVQNQWRPSVVRMLGEGWLGRARLSGRDDDVLRGLRLVAEAGLPGRDDSDLERELASASAVAQSALGRLTGDRRLIDQAIGRLRTMAAAAGPAYHGRRGGDRWRLGRALLDRHHVTGDRRDLSNGILQLEEASREPDLGPDQPDSAALLWDLAAALRSRNDQNRHDPERALNAGLQGLRERGGEVLLQASAVQGLERARDAGVQARRLVSWCLEDGRPDLAVEALERGRALVLYATTTAADVPGLLRAAAEEALARQWEAQPSAPVPPWAGPLAGDGAERPAAPAGDGPLTVPADVRQRALAVLRRSSAGAGISASLTVGRLAGVLRQAGYNAFVYLIPPYAGRPGGALLLRSDSTLEEIPLPGLPEDPAARYVAARRAPAGGGTPPAWYQPLTELCEWAGTAVIEPVLRQVAGWRLSGPPRLVLVPVGRLGAVPWHAARCAQSDGAPRYAIQDAVFSYAASAHQLAEAAGRPPRPWDESVVLVANPTGTLPFAGLEAEELYRRCYPRALYLGRPKALASGAGTPSEVLAQLPGGSGPAASLVHCGSHAQVASSLTASYLELAGGQRLTIARIVAQAQSRAAGSAGFLAVLGACLSNVADADQDEALTLASAFLAAGASGVIGALWPVADAPTALLLVMFHHYLKVGPHHPADALRAAQLWMLDPARRSLDGLSAPLADEVADAALAEVPAWAGFTYQGA